MTRIVVPIPVPSCANLREHWRAKAKRVKMQRTATTACLLAAGSDTLAVLRRTLQGPGLVVGFVRVSPRSLDSDNLAAACKAMRDAVASVLGEDDGSARYEWRYRQLRGAPKEQALWIDLWARGGGP